MGSSRGNMQGGRRTLPRPTRRALEGPHRPSTARHAVCPRTVSDTRWCRGGATRPPRPTSPHAASSPRRFATSPSTASPVRAQCSNAVGVETPKARSPAGRACATDIHVAPPSTVEQAAGPPAEVVPINIPLEASRNQEAKGDHVALRDALRFFPEIVTTDPSEPHEGAAPVISGPFVVTVNSSTRGLPGSSGAACSPERRVGCCPHQGPFPTTSETYALRDTDAP